MLPPMSRATSALKAWLLAAGLVAVAAPPAQAEEWPASVKGLKVVVPAARGSKAWGSDRITNAVRKHMKEGLGELVNPAAFTKAQQKLKLKGKARNTDENLAKAGQAAGAQWVLDLEITKQKWLYTATARLINTETGQEQMNFRSQYYKPAQEGADRGLRIAKRTVEKLDTLTREGPLPVIGPLAGGRPGKDPKPLPPPGDLGPEDVGTPPPADPLAERLDGALPPEDGPPPPPPPPAPVAERSPDAGASTPAPWAEEDDTELLRFALTAGAGLLRTYDVSSDAVANSRLSYALNPMTLVQADVELIVPGVPVTAIARGAFRPLRYEVDVGGGELQYPSGNFVDASLMAGYHLVLTGDGKRAIRLVPLVGARLGLNSQGREAGDLLLNTTLIAVQGGLLARLPFNDVLELNLGAEGGYIVSYSESPTTTGTSGAGFTVAGDLGARIWLSDTIAIAIDNRFTFEQIGLEGTPTRRLLLSEQANLQNVTLSTKDLRSSIGVAFRL
jgi:hypothetical protein